MNKLNIKTRISILNMLVEGSSMCSIRRITGVSINTVSKLLEDAGKACAAYHDATVRDVQSKDVQCDEIWSFVYTKEKNVPAAKAAPDGAGDVKPLLDGLDVGAAGGGIGLGDVRAIDRGAGHAHAGIGKGRLAKLTIEAAELPPSPPAEALAAPAAAPAAPAS